MAKFIVILHSPGVTREQFDDSAADIVKGEFATYLHGYANLAEGTIVNIYEAENTAAVEREMERLGFPFDEIARVQYEASFADLQAQA